MFDPMDYILLVQITALSANGLQRNVPADDSHFRKEVAGGPESESSPLLKTIITSFACNLSNSIGLIIEDHAGSTQLHG